MGGFGSVLATASKAAIESGAEVAAKTFRPMSAVFNESPGGQALYKILKEDFEPTLAKAKQTLTTTAQQSGSTATHTEIASQSKNIARASALGRNDAIAVAAVKWAEQTHGPVHAQNLADHLSMYLQDTVEENTYSGKAMSKLYKYGTKPQPADIIGQKTVSSFKRNATLNKDLPVELNTDPTYKPRTPLEGALQNYGSTILAPMIAIPHLGTVLNNVISSPLSSLAKGLADVASPGGYKATRQVLLDTGIFAETSLQAYRELQEYKTGFIAQATGKPQLGYILGKAIHQPGFNALRDWTLAFSGAVGKHNAEKFAQDVMEGSKRAEIELDAMGLNPMKIKAQGGHLTPEQLETAIYHAVDNKVFLNTRLGRSFNSQATPLTRTAGMFHSYVSAQGHLLRNEFMKMFKTGDVGQIAQTLAVMGIAFPVAGTLIQSLENMGRGQWKDDNLRERANNLSFQNGIWNGIEEYLDAYAHMAGFGVATSYIRGALRQQLSNSILGPVGNVAVRGVSDAAVYGYKQYKYQTGQTERDPDASQLGRDVLEDSLPDNLGKILSHQFLPTKKEQKARGNSVSKRFSSFKSTSNQ